MAEEQLSSGFFTLAEIRWSSHRKTLRNLHIMILRDLKSHL